MSFLKHIAISDDSKVPKFRQLMNQITDNISNKNIQADEKLPSINVMSKELSISRDTVEKAYRELQKQKIVISIAGKGNYICVSKIKKKFNVLYLINKLSTYKMDVFNAFKAAVGEKYQTDYHIYHCDDTLFLNLLNLNKNVYDYYVIMPHFKDNNEAYLDFTKEVFSAINLIPKEKLILLDNNEMAIEGNIIEIYQDFEDDIYKALKNELVKIRKYDTFILIVPEHSLYPYPKGILKGFKKFCTELEMPYEILTAFSESTPLNKKDLFMVIEELDLIGLIGQAKKQKLKLGKHIGVIAFNETPFKQLLNIAVISTDFQQMGETAAEMILEKRTGKVKNPFNFIIRKSI